MKPSKSFLINALIFASVSIFTTSCQKNVSSAHGSQTASATSQNVSNLDIDGTGTGADCQKAHNPFTNFNSSPNPGTATSLWLSIHTKINRSTDLQNDGDFILISNGTITLNGVSSTPAVNNTTIPDGIIIADETVSSPITLFDAVKNSWITKVPPGYTSSDIFISAAIINSSTGFSVTSGKSSVISASWYSNKGSQFSSSWFYGLACYQPQFSYDDVSGAGQVASVGGGIKAGTPIAEKENLVAGGSGGGGSNYTGSYSSTDNFVACD